MRCLGTGEKPVEWRGIGGPVQAVQEEEGDLFEERRQRRLRERPDHELCQRLAEGQRRQRCQRPGEELPQSPHQRLCQLSRCQVPYYVSSRDASYILPKNSSFFHYSRRPDPLAAFCQDSNTIAVDDGPTSGTAFPTGIAAAQCPGPADVARHSFYEDNVGVVHIPPLKSAGAFGRGRGRGRALAELLTPAAAAAGYRRTAVGLPAVSACQSDLSESVRRLRIEPDGASKWDDE